MKTPLVVDLDGTLLKNDSLVEMFVVSLLRQPWNTLKSLRMLLSGKSAFKQQVFKLNQLDVTSFPIREDFLAFLHEQKKDGLDLFLVTAADQEIANIIAKKLDIFETASGSANGCNLKGKQKLNYLQTRFPDGFTYAGDSSADLPIWKEARSIILVGTSEATRRSAQAMEGEIERDFAADRTGFATWGKALRIHQWSKNLLLFVPLVLAHQYFNAGVVIDATMAFFSMCLVASGTYLINDLSDLDADRKHKTNRHRAIASGAIGAGNAFVVAVFGIGIGLIGAFSVSISLLLIMLSYLALTLSYSFYFKRVALLDVVTLGTLYTMRLLMGSIVVSTALSPWLLMFALFFFLSLSLAKRYVEVVGIETQVGADSHIDGRGYKISDGPLILAFGVATSVVAVQILTLYVANDAYPTGDYSNPQYLWFMTPIILLWTMRIWLLSHRGKMHDDPVTFAIKDRVSWGLGFLVLLTFMAATL